MSNGAPSVVRARTDRATSAAASTCSASAIRRAISSMPSGLGSLPWSRVSRGTKNAAVHVAGADGARPALATSATREDTHDLDPVFAEPDALSHRAPPRGRAVVPPRRRARPRACAPYVHVGEETARGHLHARRIAVGRGGPHRHSFCPRRPRAGDEVRLAYRAPPRATPGTTWRERLDVPQAEDGPPSAARREPNGQGVDAESSDLRQSLAPRALSHRRHGDDGPHAEHHSENRECRSQPVEEKVAQPEAQEHSGGTIPANLDGSRALPALDAAVAQTHHAVGSLGQRVVVRDEDHRPALGVQRRRAAARSRSPVVESRLPVGSSASRRRGSLTSARAMAARCASPPESSDGGWSARCMRPTRSRTAVARDRHSDGHRGVEQSASRRSRERSAAGCRWKDWKTKPMRGLRTADSRRRRDSHGLAVEEVLAGRRSIEAARGWRGACSSRIPRVP